MKKFIIIFISIIFIFLIIKMIPNTNDNHKTTIRFSTWGSKTEYSIIKNIITKYEKDNPEIKIELIHIPEDYFRKLHLLYAAKTAPDVVFLNNTYAPLYIKADLLTDLSDFIETNDYFESAVNCFKYNEKIFALPRDVSNLVIFINKDIVKNPNNIKTIEDLKKYAKKYTSNDIFGLNYEKNPLFWLYFLNYYNGGILSSDSNSVILNSENSIKGLQFYHDMINEDKSIPHEWQMSSMTSAQMFISGKLAMYIGGRWLVPKFRETINFDWDIIPFPSNGNKILTDASGWGLSKASKNKEEAIKFIQYLSSIEVSKEFTQTGLITPARISIANSDIYLNKNLKPYNAKVFVDIINNSKPTPVNTNYSQIVDEVTKETVPYFNGNKSIKESVLNKAFINKLQRYCDKSQK